MFKKAQTLSINTIIIAAIALIVLVFLIAIFTGRFSEEYFCKQNPEQCVCEEKQTECIIQCSDKEGHKWVSDVCPDEYRPLSIIDVHGFTSCSTSISNKEVCRKKTTEELEADYCNKNPDDTGNCKCMDYNLKEPMEVVYWSVNESGEDFVNESFVPYYDIYCYVVDGDVICAGIQEGNVEYGRRVYGNVFSYGDVFSHKIIKVHKSRGCKASVPKTPCEKGDTNYIEEKKIRSPEECISLGFVQEISCPDETICREKTDYEKLLDEDCDFIERELTKCNAYLFNYCMTCQCEEEYHQNLKRAFVEKECLNIWRF